jgi:hypothetical protein
MSHTSRGLSLARLLLARSFTDNPLVTEPFPVGPNVRMRRNSKDKPTRKPKKATSAGSSDPVAESSEDMGDEVAYSPPSFMMQMPQSHHIDSLEYPPLS